MFRQAFCLLTVVSAVRIDLGGQWNVCSLNSQCYNGSVPGDIFTDLHKAGVIPDPLFGDNSLSLGWVSRTKWIYKRNFTLPQVSNSGAKVLVFQGLDTVANVLLNGKTILHSHNQFVRHVVKVDDVLIEENQLEVQFESPVLFAKEKAGRYKERKGHELPPDCPPGIYHGECHPNFIRKAQYSFSWDWGPSIPTVGIWQPVYLLMIEQPTLLSLSWVTEKAAHSWIVHATLETVSAGSEASCSAKIDDISNTTFVASGKGSKTVRKFDFKLDVPLDKVELWWPATEGNQPLYNFTVTCGNTEIREEIGFREIELVQDFIDPGKPKLGRNFYVKINGRPIFLKGSNWIPASMYPGEDTRERMEFLLDSAVEANMNVLRVWGGGIYESEFFYRLANKKGVLVWQDMMFACALYPTDKHFLSSVKREIEQQVTRLRKHPSILLFAGNNENEIAIRTHWWAAANYSEEQQVADYIRLYADTIAPLVKVLDPSRPFLLSSPSNGIETEEEGGVAKNPGSPRYGDIHFYNEFIDMWQDKVYMTPRCASEYGIQSMPFRRTMNRWINSSDWYYWSPVLVHRQHHPAGILSNLMAVFSHFPISSGCTLDNIHQCAAPDFIDRYAYYSQAHQAIAYKVQTEHYRRFRGQFTDSGEGNTMCALYWQLNDVWAAPTWSSVDFNLQWKMVHYEARRFFAPVIIVMYSTPDDSLAISIVNDKLENYKDVKLKINQHGWGSQFTPVYNIEKTISVVAALSTNVPLENRYLRDYDSDYVFSAQLTLSNGSLLAPEAVLLPDKLYESPLWKAGDVSIETFERIDPQSYRVLLRATDISPFTWISVEADYHGWFSDNGFTMVSPTKEVFLHLRRPENFKKEQFTVCNLKTCGNN